MARLNISHPTALLGRRVTGAYRSSSGYLWPFEGVVECVCVPAPAFAREHDVSFFVGGDFISVKDCTRLEYSPGHGS